MKFEYEMKMDGMQKSRTRDILLFFIKNEFKPMAKTKIMKACNASSDQLQSAISVLRGRDWCIVNTSEDGVNAVYEFRGIGRYDGKKPTLNTPKPKLNPLIESVFC